MTEIEIEKIVHKTNLPFLTHARKPEESYLPYRPPGRNTEYRFTYGANVNDGGKIEVKYPIRCIFSQRIT